MTVEKRRLEWKAADVVSADRQALSGLSFRTRIAVLWVAVAVALSVSFLLYLYVPGALEEMLAGEIEGEVLDEAVGSRLAMFVIIPLVMAAVTLLITDRANRYVNLIIGLTYGLYGSYVVTGEIVDGHFDGHILMTVVACVLGLLIAALALIALRQSADRPSPST